MDPLNGGGAGLEGGRPEAASRGVLGFVELVLVSLAAIAVLTMGVYIALGVVLRSLGLGGVPDEVVVVGDLMIAALILPLAYVAAGKGFIAVEVFTEWVGPRGQAWLDVLAAIVGLVAIAPIAFAAYLNFSDAVASGDYSFGVLNVPQWPARLVFLLGYAVFCLRLLALLAQSVLQGAGLRAADAHRPQSDNEEA